MKKFFKVAVCSFATGFLIFGSPTAKNYFPQVSANYQGEVIAAPNVAVVQTR